MIPRVLPGVMVACLAALAGCAADSATGTAPTTVTDPTAFTVSYRNQVRLPTAGSPVTAERFASQVKTSDPIGKVRCGAEESPEYGALTAFLGGIQWSHPISIIKDSSLPPLFGQRLTFSSSEGRGDMAGAAPESSAAPNIERPDLVGVRGGIAIFLSKVHGLIAVDARGQNPVPSCAMKLPGTQMSFFFKDDELVVLVNALRGHNRAALVRYSVRDGKFGFVDAVQLPDQTIRDARLFDSTLVAYTDWSEERKAPEIADPPPVGSGSATGGFGANVVGSSGGSGGRAAAGAPAESSSYYDGTVGRIGSKVIVVNWDDALGIDWEDSLVDDPVIADPMLGRDPNEKLEVGQVVSSRKQWQPFAVASDRYLAIPRHAQRTKFVGYKQYSYQVCAQYNPQHHQRNVCSVKYERRPNPDYKPPSPTTGDYSCNGQKLADCIKEAAPVVSQYIEVPVSQSCSLQWFGACERYETRTATYPDFEQEDETELVIYRFEAGAFTKLDGQLAKMVTKEDAIAFEYQPLAVKGRIANRNQVQFQSGHLYVFSDQALQTLAMAGNSIAYVNRLATTASTDGNPSVVFSTDRAMISAQRYQESQVEMLDLTEPALPKPLTSFSMPGASTQLILANGGILGPGSVSFAHERVHRSLQKITLFDHASGNELDNLLLGTEYDTFSTSWLAAQDDQRIRLGSNGQRVFVPYSGRHHADEYEPTAHSLNISRIENGRLVSERSFDVSEEIIRTAPLDDSRSLVFSDSASYLVDRTTGDWSLSTLRELFVPFATYRVSDAGDLHARVDRVGSKCRIRTFAGNGGIFGDEPLAQLDIPCGESSLPRGFSSSLLWHDTLTGVSIGPDGKTLTALDRATVESLLQKIPTKRYCWVEGGEGAAVIDYLDAVPSKILCEDVP